jgi:hypothetical protein
MSKARLRRLRWRHWAGRPGRHRSLPAIWACASRITFDTFARTSSTLSAPMDFGSPPGSRLAAASDTVATALKVTTPGPGDGLLIAGHDQEGGGHCVAGAYGQRLGQLIARSQPSRADLLGRRLGCPRTRWLEVDDGRAAGGGETVDRVQVNLSDLRQLNPANLPQRQRLPARSPGHCSNLSETGLSRRGPIGSPAVPIQPVGVRAWLPGTATLAM